LNSNLSLNSNLFDPLKIAKPFLFFLPSFLLLLAQVSLAAQLPAVAHDLTRIDGSLPLEV
jgi:hypothetical protein